MRSSMIETKIISAVEKIFWDEDISKLKAFTNISVLKNEKFSFQLAYKGTELKNPFWISVEVEGKLKECLDIKQVANISSTMPVPIGFVDKSLKRSEPGLYPDVILPLHYNKKVYAVYGFTSALWIDVNLPENIKAGEYSLVFNILNEDGENLDSKCISITVINEKLPHQKVLHTEWLHTDCLAEYYNVEVFSDRHFEVIENYINTAVSNGINVLMMPVFTPELDTYIGGERLTTQLVDITVENGEYSFDFSKMNRWIEMCKKCGVEYYEIPHIYSQWGAKAAPKFMATVDGVYKRIFGWETESASKEYQDFLQVFLSALIKQLEVSEIKEKTFFHISDEPNINDYPTYLAAQRGIADILKDFPIIDAVSDIEYCLPNMVPVASVKRIDSFIEQNIRELWLYYCGGDCDKVTNRYFSMPLYRTRILGIQMYLYNIKGFLHWGYNFWHNRYSYDCVDPYLETSGEFFAPSGDMSIVYPAKDGTANESIRLKAMRDAFQDLRALELCESLYGRKYTEALINDGLDYEITFKNYPNNGDYILNLRKKVNSAIAEFKQRERK